MWFETAIVSGGGSKLATKLWRIQNLDYPLLRYELGVQPTRHLHIAAQLCIDCLQQQCYLLRDAVHTQNPPIYKHWQGRLQNMIAMFQAHTGVPRLATLCRSLLSTKQTQHVKTFVML